MTLFARNPNFVGRDDVLIDVESKLRFQPRVAIVGHGGVGYGSPVPSNNDAFNVNASKSQVAIEYSYRMKHKVPHLSVFWVHASSVTRFEQAYSDIAKKLKLTVSKNSETDALQLVMEWLAHEDNHPWLLVIDSADDEDIFMTQQAGD